MSDTDAPVQQITVDESYDLLLRSNLALLKQVESLSKRLERFERIADRIEKHPFIRRYLSHD